MAIAQMNWGRMRFAPDDPRLSEFMAALDTIYRQAEAHRGFIWRIPDDDVAQELKALVMMTGYQPRFRFGRTWLTSGSTPSTRITGSFSNGLRNGLNRSTDRNW